MSSMAERNLIPKFALMGAISGAVAGPLVYLGAPAVGMGAPPLVFPFVGIMPGLLFGLVFGWALHRRQFLDDRSYLGYLAVSAGACWAATQITILLNPEKDQLRHRMGEGNPIQFFLSDGVQTSAQAGAIGGMIGAFLLTAYTLYALSGRRPAMPSLLVIPCLLMVASGTLGYLVKIFLRTGDVIPLMLLYSAWQSGYAACLALLLLEYMPAPAQVSRPPAIPGSPS